MAQLHNNRFFHNGLIATTGAIALTAASSAEFTGLSHSVSSIDQDGWTAPDPRSLVLVSLYADFSVGTDQLISVYGDGDDTLSITTSDDGGFWQFNADGGQAYTVCNTSIGINTVLPYSSQTSDSFVTIGFTSDEEGAELNLLQQIGVDFADFNPPTLIGAEVTTDNGAWFCTPDDYQTIASHFPDNKVLIGQFAVAVGETVSGSVSIQWRDGAGLTTYSPAQSFSATAALNPVMGDLTGDGYADITLQRTDLKRLWALMGSDSGVSAEFLGTNNISGWTILGVADVTGDARANVVIQRDDLNRLGYYDWDGMSLSYNKINSGNLTDWAFRGFGDLNGDGTEDLLFQKISGSNAFKRLGVYKMTGGSGSWQTLPDRGDLSAWNVLGCGDLTGDGIDDIVLQKNTLTRLGYYACSVSGGGDILQSWVLRSSNNLTGWTFAGIGDIDGNGQDDTLFKKDTSTQIRSYWGAIATSKTFNTFNFSNWQIIGASDLDGNATDVILMQKTDKSKIAKFTRSGSQLLYSELNSGDWSSFTIVGY